LIVTDRFVLLNYPRTGSTFVREVLRTLYGRRDSSWDRALQHVLPGRTGFRELLLPIYRTRSARRERRRSQHGCYAQIPQVHRGKPVLSVARHPMDRLVSQYEHRFWRDHPPAEAREIRRRLPSFPDLSFTEFLELQASFGLEAVLQGLQLRADVGSQTVHFLRFYHPHPDEALACLTDEVVDSGRLRLELPVVHFIHLERLAEELRGFLHSVGFEESETEFLVDKPPVNVARERGSRPWREYFSVEQILEFRRRERLLFQVFPEYDD